MDLEHYNSKRDFSNTPEPLAEVDSEDQYRFVVQRHRASHLHYDLRLEMGGVLKSWAVPKGPSMNPKDKRLAVQTEDHPVKYLFFEGVIPKGNYGAGKMDIWDNGIYTSQQTEKDLLQQFKKGKLNITFFGKKIKGDFTLVRSSSEERKNHWLLIKTKDTFATDLAYDAENFAPSEAEKKEVSAASLNLDTAVAPMLASPGKNVFNDPAWIYELKYDGYRALAHIKEGEVHLYSRNGISFNSKFRLIHEELTHIPHTALLDGEIVIVDEKGVPQFQPLQNYDPETTQGTLRYYVFDLLHLNGHDTLSLPLTDRKSLLPDLIEGLDYIFYSDHIEGMGKTLFARAVEMGMEGIIAKRAASDYTPGYRTESWLKLKKTESTEAIICGYTLSDKSTRAFGSLILGMLDEGKMAYVGNCGSGFSAKKIKELHHLFTSIQTSENPFKEKINLKGREAVWLDPIFICEVTFSEWTKDHHMRHPVFKGLREDKSIAEVTTEQFEKKEATTTEARTEENKKTNEKKTLSTSKKEHTLEVGGIMVPVSNPTKVFWPESGLTKYDLLDYYIQVSDVILPYLADRPQNLHRHPNGIQKPGFYQKDNEHLPEWVETFSIHSKSGDKEIEYLLCQNEATLLYMANLGCIEINPWHSTIHQLENPTYTVIDLDPSKKNTFQQVIETALVAKEVLDMAKITGFCKTSGSSGLHIYIPLHEAYSYDEAVDFTKLLCYYIAEKLPKITTMERSIKKRGDKIYLDYLQNRRGQTIASAYSVRPKVGATVSTPVTWEEIEKGIKVSDFNIHTVPRRLQQQGDLFKEVLSEKTDMQQAIQHLENL